MLPTVYDIAVKDVAKIDINLRLNEAIKEMAKLDVRTIVVSNSKKYHILTTSFLIDLKLQNIDVNTKLIDLNLPIARSVERDLSILTILNQLNSTTEYMVILDDDQELIGIVSYTDLINNVDPKILMQRQKIGSLILNYKATFIYENSSTIQAIKLIRENKNDSIIIKNSEEQHIGIFTTKDFMDIIQGEYDFELPISNYMVKPLITLSQEATIAQALDFIKEMHFKRIVVVDENEKVVGIINQKELLRVVYNKWIDLLKEEGNKISKINEELLASKSKLEEVASLDFLTQIYNRNKFESFLEYEIKKHARYENEIFSLLILDLDFFKEVNDTYGHLKGDYVLQEFARILKLSSRDSDLVARWGGEEFIILLPLTNIDEAILVAEKVRASIESHDFDNIKITCSVGIAQSHIHDTKDTVFKRADKALYKAKELGRNRVEIEVLDKFKV